MDSGEDFGNMCKNINFQVQMQLEYLKGWVDYEIEREERYKEWGLPYVPSLRKYEDIYNYNEYLKEIDKNGDKNLLVIGKCDGKFYEFAKRYVHPSYGRYLFIHRTKHGTEILVKEDDIEIKK